MTVLDILTKIAGNASGLAGLLRDVAAKAPDLAPLANDWIGKLETAASAENLKTLGVDIIRELGDVATGKFDGREHPSDAI